MTSILTDTKKILGVVNEVTAFDLDITTHINSTIGILNQLGLCPDGFRVESVDDDWDDLNLTDKQLGMVKTYLYLKVRMLFDPPSTSFHIEAMNHQIEEHEQRLIWAREELIPLVEGI